MSGVDADEEYGGRLAGEHLLSCGYKKFAYIGSWHDVKVCLDRQHGFAVALRQGGAELLPENVFYAREAEFSDIIGAIVAGGVDGIFCFNDIIAFMALEALGSRGLEAGADFGLVGYDNIQQMMRMPRIITTIDVGINDFAVCGAEQMLKLLAGEQTAPFRSNHRTVLVKGGSTR